MSFVIKKDLQFEFLYLGKTMRNGDLESTIVLYSSKYHQLRCTPHFTQWYTHLCTPSFTPLTTSAFTLNYNVHRRVTTTMYTQPYNITYTIITTPPCTLHITYWCTHPRTPSCTILNVVIFHFFTYYSFLVYNKKVFIYLICYNISLIKNLKLSKFLTYPLNNEFLIILKNSFF